MQIWSQDTENYLHSNLHFEKILEGLYSSYDKQIESLDDLATTLAYGDSQSLNLFPIYDIFQRVLELLNNTQDPNLIRLGSQTIFSCLEGTPRSTPVLMELNMPKILLKHILFFQGDDIIYNCLLSISTISNYRPAEVGLMINLLDLLTNIDFFNENNQKICIGAIEKITKVFCSPNFIEIIPKLIEVTNFFNFNVSNSAHISINNILSKVSNDFFLENNILEKIYNLLINIKKIDICYQYILNFVKLSNNSEINLKLLNIPFNFNYFLFNEDLFSFHSEIQQKILKIIENIYEIQPLISKKILEDFSIKIQPILLKLLNIKPFNINLILNCINYTFLYNNNPNLEMKFFIILDNIINDSNIKLILKIIPYLLNFDFIRFNTIFKKINNNLNLKKNKKLFNKIKNIYNIISIEEKYCLSINDFFNYLKLKNFH